MESINFKDGTYVFEGKPKSRDKPELAFAHRHKTRDHLAYLQAEKLLDVRDARWAKATKNGETYYAHEYGENILIIKLETKDKKLSLFHNEDGRFDNHLMDNPGENTVYSITSSNNGLISTHTFSVESAGLSSVGIIFAALAFAVSLANGVMAALAATYVASAFATMFGAELNVILPGAGIVLAVLAFIGIWIAYSVGREIMLNLIYENRSNKPVTLVDHYVYNIGDSQLMPTKLNPITTVGPFEFYSDVVVNIDNYSKIRGIGVSLKFQKENGSSLIICIRNDIYKDPHYTIQSFVKDDKTSAQDIYNQCSGDLVTDDFKWGSDLVVKDRLDKTQFPQYNFAGILSFHNAG